MYERGQVMRFNWALIGGRLYPYFDAHPANLLGKLLLAGPIPNVFNNTVGKCNVVGFVLERQMAAISDK
jgi:hypothetical protein